MEPLPAPDASPKEEEAILKVIRDSYETTRTRNFERFKSIHMFRGGYTCFSGFASRGLEEHEQALLRERKWFYEIAPTVALRINKLGLTIVGDVAICTLTVVYWCPHDGRGHETKTRGTVVLRKTNDSWKIFHEHYSPTSLPGHSQVASQFEARVAD
jgi:hypothetical protein